MYSRILVPLDGSHLSEAVTSCSPYPRTPVLGLDATNELLHSMLGSVSDSLARDPSQPVLLIRLE